MAIEVHAIYFDPPIPFSQLRPTIQAGGYIIDEVNHTASQLATVEDKAQILRRDGYEKFDPSTEPYPITPPPHSDIRECLLFVHEEGYAVLLVNPDPDERQEEQNRPDNAVPTTEESHSWIHRQLLTEQQPNGWILGEGGILGEAGIFYA